MTATILSLHSYPVKSCAGIDHAHSPVSQGGLFRDRQWVVVDAQGIFMTQRGHARMALIRPSFSGDDLVLAAPGMPAHTVPWLTDTDDPAQVPVKIWRSDTLGFDEGDGAAEWLSRFLGTPCRLLRVHPLAMRIASPEHVHNWRLHNYDLVPEFPEKHHFGFADGFPFLVANQASLDELNRQLAAKGEPPVPMNRFRPNIVLQGLEPYEEDYLSAVRIGPMTLAFVKRCARCPIPNIDQATAQSRPEPGLTLAQHRRFEEGVLFGVNAVVAGAGPGARLAVGDEAALEYAI
ncbi:MOSC domain-containing protein [Parapusillimonas granuli]|uniref:MOSC domain-containing protein n=1 Tax=Parapusillimonas granuli TaxID=380911 RepID=A0A853FZW6_9BURK|nr:MOSC N-terminal beta barrel domain-containing protein [Parapusillimonas granuli]MBB5216563.1 hypothetical protein [Parapusillimonas granuli]MEB2399694.1 MOSC domain-containing protein [Alcaligenaceae bacterium]NYT48131.1 MOSC domain-containing protein [Parapusillimonas granuli]